MTVSGGNCSATCAIARSKSSNERSASGASCPVVLDGTRRTLPSQSRRALAKPLRAVSTAALDASILYWSPESGNGTPRNRSRGTRTTRWASWDPILTNAFITRSSGRSCAFAGNGTNIVQNSQAAARQIERFDIDGSARDSRQRPRSTASWPLATGFLLVLVVVAGLYLHELLDAAAGNCF